MPATDHHVLTVSMVSDVMKYSKDYDNESTHFDSYETVLKPLLDNAEEAYVYNGRKDRFYLYGKWNDPIDLESIPFLVKEKGKYRIDAAKAQFNRYEYFWNPYAFKRGSIMIILPNDFDFIPIFHKTYSSYLLDNPNTGNTPSATKRCRGEVSKGRICVLFSASNGIEFFAIYTTIKHRDELLSVAEKICLKEE